MGLISNAQKELMCAFSHFIEFEKNNKHSFVSSVILTLAAVFTVASFRPDLWNYILIQFALLSYTHFEIAVALVLFLEIAWLQAYLELILGRSWINFFYGMWLELTKFYLQNNPARNKLVVMVVWFGLYMWVAARLGFDFLHFILLWAILRELKGI